MESEGGNKNFNLKLIIMNATDVFSAMMAREYITINNSECFTDLEVETNVFKIHSCEEDCCSIYHPETEQVFYDIMYEDVILA